MNTKESDLSTNDLCGLCEVSAAEPTHYNDWAVGLLCAGHDSRNLRILAGLNSDDFPEEYEYHLVRAMAELGLTQVDRETAALYYAKYACRQFQLGKLSAFSLIRSLHELDQDYEGQYLNIWTDLYYDYEYRSDCYAYQHDEDQESCESLDNALDASVKLLAVATLGLSSPRNTLDARLPVDELLRKHTPSQPVPETSSTPTLRKKVKTLIQGFF